MTVHLQENRVPGAGRFTEESARHHVLCYMAPPAEGSVFPDLREEVVAHMVATDECLWHACHVVNIRAYNDGRIPTDICSACGGRNRAGEGDHHLCTARAARGNPTPKLDIVDALQCHCSPCSKARGER
jgi:hypothetical protein